MASTAILSQGAGYGVVLGIGFFFSGFMILITYIQSRYTAYKASSSEEFTSASRSVKPGLIASGIVSAWTWAATLLQSSAVAYKYGISGPWWYAAGATVQVLLFAQNAAKLKLNAPFAHTFLEVIGKRWGTTAHLVMMFFALATNVIVSSMLILGGSATVSALTGMSTLAACFLIPLSVCIYVLVGGMRSTLLADYTHTTVLFVIIMVFMFTVYATGNKIGSVGKMWELLEHAQEVKPVPANKDGSYLTMRSKNGLIFGVINVIGNFATVYNDQAYWQRAVASRPQTAVKGFLLGGLAWFSVPFGFATTMGLAAVALSVSDPTFPPLTADQVSAGLPAPTAAGVLLGKGGAAIVLVLLFLAVTSATSGELIAVSSIFTYDIYKTYFNPHADEKQMMWASHVGVMGYGLIMGILGLVFYYIGISMGWLYEFMGVVLGSAVAPIALSIMSTRANKWGCLSGSILGLAAGLIAWLVTASTLNGGEISVSTTGQDYPMLAGNLASIGVGTIISVIATLLWPENFDFSVTRARSDIPTSTLDMMHEDAALDNRDSEKSPLPGNEKEIVSTPSTPHIEGAKELSEEVKGEGVDENGLKRSFRLAVWSSVTLFVVLMLVIPLPLFFSEHVYSKADLTVWVVVAFTWVFVGASIVIIYPIFESRLALFEIGQGIVADLTGKRKRPVSSRSDDTDESKA